MPLESDLVPYHATATIPASRVLVLAPHADDEVFGCGGAIAGHARAGVPVHVVVLTDGAAGGDPGTRQAEARAAGQVLGYGEPEFWSYPDRGLRYDESTLRRIEVAIADSGADLLYAPSPWEVHPDHRQAAVLAAEAVRRTGIRVAFYEVGAPLRPNVLLDITALADVKQRAMQCFASQLAKQDYRRHIEALNQFRTYTLPGSVTAAEAYLLLSAEDIDTHGSSQAGLDALSLGGTPSAPSLETQAPLVSILIRSMDRPHLQEALDSVALQTYANIEVVVVAARPGHQALPARCGRFPLRLVTTEEPLPRSRAANRALTEARGDFLLFLDDDDWLMPSHVARLARLLRAQPHSVAAYTGVAMADPDGRPLGQVFDLPFDGVRQLAGNLTPIHAVLFSKDLLTKGCRFDEKLDRLEDWDFWLQIARHGPMAHLPGVSATYRIHTSSGVHEDSGPQGLATQAIYEKWRSSWDAGQGAALMERAWRCNDLEVELAQARGLIAHLDESVSSQARAVHQMTVTLSERSHAAAQLTHSVAELTDSAARLSMSLSHQTSANQALATQLETRLRELETKSQEAAHHEYLASDRQRRIDDLLASSSWRLTKPLRWLSSRFKPKP